MRIYGPINISKKFVDENSDLIKTKLGNPNMTRKEMLDALAFGDFERHKKNCFKWEMEGKIPKYSENNS